MNLATQRVVRALIDAAKRANECHYGAIIDGDAEDALFDDLLVKAEAAEALPELRATVENERERFITIKFKNKP